MTHKIYLGIIAALVVIAVVLGTAWASHVKDEAKREAVIEQQQKMISDLHDEMSKRQDELKQELAGIEKQKQQVIVQPQLAPQIIRESIPFSTPIIQTAPITKETAPDAPVAQLNRQQEVELALFAEDCKEDKKKLGSCGQDKVDMKKEIDGLKVELAKTKPQGLWHKVGQCAIRGAIGGAAGGLSGDVRKAGAGLSIGVGSCLVWRP